MRDKKSNIILKLKIVVVIAALLFVTITPIITAKNLEKTISNNQEIIINYTGLTSVDFQITAGEFSIDSIEGDGDIYDRLIMDHSGYTSDYGKVELPAISSYVGVPQGAEVILDFEISDVQEYYNYDIYPAQPPMPETDGYIDPPFTKDETFYSKDEFYPSPNVEITGDFILRGCRILRVTSYPFSYNPVTKVLKKYNEIDVSIDFIGGTGEFIPERLQSIHFQYLYDNFLVNAQDIERATTNNPQGTRGTRADLLIVTYDSFYNAILPLANWRHQTGIETKVVKWSTIGSSASDLRNYMTNAYNSWELPPSYLLIVGDADHVPVNYLENHPYHGSKTGTDHWYVAVDGSDYFPDMHTGRISVEDASECADVVDKILDYSKTPYTSVNWFDDILLAAKQESGRYFVYTSERIYDFLNPKGYNCNRQYSGTTPPGSTQGVIDAVNNGVIIANHRDHGAAENDGYSYTGWSSPQFDTTHIPALTNGEKYAVMYALHCDSGWFDGETDSNSGNWESIGEVGIRVANKGFSAVIASTRVSYSGYNDEFCVGMYDAMWQDFDPNYPNGGQNPYTTAVYRISQVMNYGKFWMYDVYVEPGGCSPYPWTPSDTVSRTTFEMFHVHGDPTMDVWTSMPSNLDVTYEILTNLIEVTVKKGGSPVKGALVCAFQENGFYAKGVTSSSGVVTLDAENPSSEEVTLTVTAHNYKYNKQNFFLNRAPEKPAKPNGEERPDSGISYDYETFTTDAEGEDISYWFDWGDNTSSGWLGPFPSGNTIFASHAWSKRGPFVIKVKAKDINDQESEWSEPLEIMVANTIPPIPVLTGQQNFVMPHKTYEYKVKITEPDDDPIWVWVSWSDGGSTGWKGPFSSGYTFKTSHVWMEYGQTYIVSAKTKDIFDEESDWAELEIHTMKSRAINLDIIDILLQRFPLIKQIFERLFF